MLKESDLGEAVRRYAFTVADYYRMGEAGIFADGARVELLGGEVIEVSPMGSRHGGCITKLIHLFSRLCGDDALVQVQVPVVLDDYSEPEPDIALLRPRPDFYSTQKATPADTFLIIEVADSSLGFDRSVKAPLYARAGVPHFWILAIDDATLEMYSEPSPLEGYRLTRIVRRGERVTVPIPGSPELTLDDMLPDAALPPNT